MAARTKTGTRTLAARLAACLTLAALTACGGSGHEAVADDMIAGFEEVGTVLQGVEDEGDMRDAMDELNDIADDMQELARRWSELGEPDEATRERIAKKLESRGADFETSMQTPPKYFQEHPEAMFELMEPLQRIGEAFGEMH